MFPDPTTGVPTPGIAKVRYRHDAMIDLIIAQPTLDQNEIAALMGYTPTWVSQVINSDAFQARLAERREEVIDPVLSATIKDRLQAVASESLSRVLERVMMPGAGPSDDFLLNTAKFATAALGYGARPQGGGSEVNVGVIVQVPAKTSSVQEWVDIHTPAALPGAAV